MTYRLPISFSLAIVAALACWAGLVTLTLWGQEEPSSGEPFVIYLADGPYVTEQTTRNGVTYLPLADLVRRLELPYTDATAIETFTIRAPNGTLAITARDRTLLIDGEGLELPEPALRENGRWLAPLQLIERGLAAVTGTTFRTRDGAPRMIEGSLLATSLDMEAAEINGLTRLTIRSGAGVNVRVQRAQDENRVTLSLDRAPMDPSIEVLNYRDTSVRSVRFDDSDGNSKIIVETTPQLANVRLLPMDENRTFLIEFIPETATAATGLGRTRASDPRVSLDRVRVIVIDPGHGGLDSGTSAHGMLEKDLTLALARRLRQALQARTDSTVILTRDQDNALSGEIRSAIANSSEADVLISLHVGFSPDSSESGASLFVMKAPSSEAGAATPNDALFKSWYGVYADQRDSSRTFAGVLEQELSRAIPGLKVPIREAPLSILASAAMPAVVIEIGNANNVADLNALTDAAFQDRWIDALTNAVAGFNGTRDEAF